MGKRNLYSLKEKPVPSDSDEENSSKKAEEDTEDSEHHSDGKLNVDNADECDDGNSCMSTENTRGCGEMDCICRLLKLVWNASGAKLKWNFNLNMKLNISNEGNKSKRRISTARKKRPNDALGGKNNNDRLERAMDENGRVMGENKRLHDGENDFSKTVQQLEAYKANINKLEKELDQLREQSIKPFSLSQSQSSQHAEELQRLLSELGQARLDAIQMEEQHQRDVEAIFILKEELASSKKLQESLAEEMAAMEFSHQCAMKKMFESITSIEHEKQKGSEELHLKIDKLQTELDEANEQSAATEKDIAQLPQKFHDVVIEKNLSEQYIDKNIVREPTTQTTTQPLAQGTENTYILEGGSAIYSCAICKERFTKFACWHTHWMSCYMRKPSFSKSEKM